jgi:hypothetical protein
LPYISYAVSGLIKENHVAITPETTEETLRLYRQNPRRFSPFKTATVVGISVEEVFQIIEDNKEKLNAAQERYAGFGRPELQPFTMARRQATERGWNNDDEGIISARAQYEAGTHEMTTGRDGQWLILYSIPRQRKAPSRLGYFTPEHS